jgi:hypothetical protein
LNCVTHKDNYTQAVWVHDSILFAFDSVEALQQELHRYFDPLRAGVAFVAS